MIFFVFGAGLGFALIALAWPLTAAATRVLVTGASGAADGPPAAHVLRGCLLVGVIVVFAWLIDSQFLEAERNIRLFLGAVFGATIGGLAVARRRTGTRASSAPPAAMGVSDPGQAPLGPDDSIAAPPAAEPAPPGPWWIRPSSLVPVALIALPLFALVAPRGEMDLSFIRSVKTPFVEAQFTKNEVEFRLDLESEPQGFFRLGPYGLGDAVHMARNEVIYRERFPDGADLANGQVAPPADALRFITDVLQPMALCAYEVDQLYGDQEILFDNLRTVSTGLTRALKLSTKALEDPNLPPGRVEELAQHTLLVALRRIDGERRRLMPALDMLSDEESSCQGSFSQNLQDFLNPAAQETHAPPPTLVAVMRNPAVVHAATMFYLWSGNPRAVLKILAAADAGTAALTRTSSMPWLSDYPALAFIRGYAKRWEGQWGSYVYLAEWERAIDLFQARLDRLHQNAPAIRKACDHNQLPVFRHGRTEFPHPLSAPPLPAACSPDSAADCNAQLAYGYYTFQLNIVRNHLIFETAREMMIHRSRQEKEPALYRALGHAERSAAFVEADGLRAGNCFTQQAVGPADGDAWHFVVTTINPDHEYAALLDSLGSLIAAKALVINDGDKAVLEAAVKTLDESLEHAAMAGDQGPFLETIRDHRAKARQALGLSDR